MTRRAPSSAAIVVALALAPLVLGKFGVSLLNDIGIAALVALGLVLLTGIGGATSFGQAAFVGIAAYASAWLTTAHGASPWLGLVFALGPHRARRARDRRADAAPRRPLPAAQHDRLGPLDRPAVRQRRRVRPPHRALERAVAGDRRLLARRAARDLLPDLDRGRARLRVQPQPAPLAAGARDPEPARRAVLLASVGADAFRVRLALFVLAALLAGLAGWLYAHMNRFVSPSPFDVRASIEYLLMAVGGGLGQLSGALAGAAVVLLLKNVLQDVLPLVTQRAGQLQAVAFAVIFILLLQHARGGLMGFVRRWTRGRFAPPEVDAASLAGAAPLPRRTLPPAGERVLAVEGAVKRFGGLVAVDDVSFDVRAGEIVGLIGPNGAGKSTLFNLLTRTVPMSAGRIEFLGRDVSKLSQRSVARLGMARTFQHVKLRPQMSLLDNVALGAHGRTSAGLLAAGFGLDRAEERRILAEAMRQLERVGLARARTSSPAASRSAPSAPSRSPARSPPTRCCSCSTSPRRASAARRSTRSPSCCAACAARARRS
jgi:branched-chain amino acid transport system permease protein